MKICDYGHDEICFDGGECPLCEKNKEILGLEDEIDYTKRELAAAEERVSELESMLFGKAN